MNTAMGNQYFLARLLIAAAGITQQAGTSVMIALLVACGSVALPGPVFAAEAFKEFQANENPEDQRLEQSGSGVASITRAIDADKLVRPWPRLTGYRNTSLQKAPAPALAAHSAALLGRPRIVRCFLNLDEAWDYRTRAFDFNRPIGMNPYRSVKEKHPETWGWQLESKIRYEDYLTAFSRNSDEILLVIRRYERDVLDGKLPISFEDWKMIFKEGLKHCKKLCPNICYVEVCNEYHHKGFIGCAAEEYYKFYRLGYQAVNEVNAELGLQGDDRIGVGGPVAAREAMQHLPEFLFLYRADPSPDKRLDFVSWHDYGKPFAEMAHKGAAVRKLLTQHGLDPNLPLFLTETDPFQFTKDKTLKNWKETFHMLNASGLVKVLYFADRHSPGMKVFPWALYHNSQQQLHYVWFDGPNDPDTTANQLRLMPIGVSMQLLGWHKGQEIEVDNALERDDLVLASSDGNTVAVHAINYGGPRPVEIRVKLPAHWRGPESAPVEEYLLDSTHNNHLTGDTFSGGAQRTGKVRAPVVNSEIVLRRATLEQNGILFWRIMKGE